MSPPNPQVVEQRLEIIFDGPGRVLVRLAVGADDFVPQRVSSQRVVV